MSIKIGGSDGINVPEYITGKRPPHFGFPADRLKEVYQKPDKSEMVKWDDLEIRLFLKHERKFTDILAIQWSPQPRGVAFALRALPSLCKAPLALLSPLRLVKKTAEKFGLEATIADKRGKFFLREKVDMLPGANAGQLVQLTNPHNHECLQTFFIKLTPPVVSIGLAFCLDTREYGKWLKNH